MNIRIGEKILLSINEAAEVSGVSRKVIEMAIRSGCLPTISIGKNGGKIKIKRTDLENFWDKAKGYQIDDDLNDMLKLRCKF